VSRESLELRMVQFTARFGLFSGDDRPKEFAAMCSVVASRAEDPACNFAGAYSSVHHQLSQTADLLRASDYVCEQANQILAPFAETGASMVIQGAAVAYFYIVLRGVHDISKWEQADDEATVERRRKAEETVRSRPNNTVAKVRKRLEVLANEVFPSYRDIPAELLAVLPSRRALAKRVHVHSIAAQLTLFLNMQRQSLPGVNFQAPWLKKSWPRSTRLSWSTTQHPGRILVM